MQLKRADHVRMSRKGRRRLHWRSGHVARLAGTRRVSLIQFAAGRLYVSQSSTNSFSAVSAANFALVSDASMHNSVLQKGWQSFSAMWRRCLVNMYAASDVHVHVANAVACALCVMGTVWAFVFRPNACVSLYFGQMRLQFFWLGLRDSGPGSNWIVHVRRKSSHLAHVLHVMRVWVCLCTRPKVAVVNARPRLHDLFSTSGSRFICRFESGP